MPKHFTIQEVEEMKHLANAKYDARIEQYNMGITDTDKNKYKSPPIFLAGKDWRGTVMVNMYHYRCT